MVDKNILNLAHHMYGNDAWKIFHVRFPETCMAVSHKLSSNYLLKTFAWKTPLPKAESQKAMERDMDKKKKCKENNKIGTKSVKGHC